MAFWLEHAWIICIVAGSSCFTAGLQIWSRGAGPRIASIAAMMFALGCWAVGYGLVLYAPDLSGKMLARMLQMLGFVAVPPSLIMLGLTFGGRERLITARNVLLIHVPSVIAMALILTNQGHNLMFTDVWLVQGSRVPWLAYGPGFWLFMVAYPVTVILWCVIQMLQARGKAVESRRRDIYLLLLALAPPLLGTALYYAYFLPRGAPDPTPLSFLATALVVSYAAIGRARREDPETHLTGENTEVHFKVHTVRFLATLAVPTITYFTVVEITHVNTFEIAILAAMLLTVLGALVLMGFNPSPESMGRYFSLGLTFFVVLFGLLNLKLVLESGESGQILWALIFPLVAVLAFGGGRGLAVSAAFLACGLLGAQLTDDPQLTLLNQFGLRFLVTYSVITLIFYIVDRKRRLFLNRTMQQRDALDLASRQWRRTFDAMGDAVCLVDSEQRILRCNRAAAEHFGRRIQDVPGSTCFQLAHPGRQPGKDCPQRAARETGTRQERILPAGDRWFREIADPILDADGAVLGFVHIISDITQQKNMEAETARLNKELAQAQKRESLGIVAGGVAHDFNNLLNGILGFNDLAKTSLPPDSPAREHLDSITGLGMKAVRLTRNMLDYTGRGKGVSREVDISRLVEDMWPTLHAAAPAGVDLEFHLAQGLPPARVDSAQLSQALTNLVTNAGEAVGGQGGLITISTGSEVCSLEDLRATGFYEDQQPGEYLYLEVADNGPGLDPEILDRIFDPFFTTRFPGRGLGLATVLGVMRSHGGAVRVRNQPGAGAAFRLLLPMAGTGAPAASAAP